MTSKNQWEIPTGEGVYANYAARRNKILTMLMADMKVTDIARELNKSQAAIYMDMAKTLNETGCVTYWGMLMEAIRRGWVTDPTLEELEERPPCPE